MAASYVVLLHHVERLILARMGGPLPANTPVNLPNMQKTIMKHRPLVAEPCEPTLVWKVATGGLCTISCGCPGIPLQQCELGLKSLSSSNLSEVHSPHPPPLDLRTIGGI